MRCAHGRVAQQYAGVGMQARRQIHCQYQSRWPLQSANGIGDGPRWRAIRSQAEHGVDVQIGMRGQTGEYRNGHPGRLGFMQGLRGVWWQSRGLPKQTHLHTAACLVQPARGHQTIAAVVAGACPDLDAGSMGCDCLRQPRYSQASACHQGVRRVLAQRGHLGHPRGARVMQRPAQRAAADALDTARRVRVCTRPSHVRIVQRT